MVVFVLFYKPFDLKTYLGVYSSRQAALNEIQRHLETPTSERWKAERQQFVISEEKVLD